METLKNVNKNLFRERIRNAGSKVDDGSVAQRLGQMDEAGLSRLYFDVVDKDNYVEWSLHADTKNRDVLQRIPKLWTKIVAREKALTIFDLERLEVENILAMSTEDSFIEAVSSLMEWSSRTRKESVIEGNRVKRNLFSRKFINKFVEISSTLDESALPQFVSDFAHIFRNDQNDVVACEARAFSPVLKEVLEAFTIQEVTRIPSAQFQDNLESFIQQPNERSRKIFLLLTELFVENGFLQSDYWLTLFTNTTPLSVQREYLELGYSKLFGENGERYWQTRLTPDRIFDASCNIIYGAVQTVADKYGDRFPNSKIIRGQLDTQRVARRIPIVQVIRIGNALIDIINRSGGFGVASEGTVAKVELEKLNEQNLSELGKAGLIIHRVIFSNDQSNDVYRETLCYLQVADELAILATQAKADQEVLTIGDLALRFPEADIDQLKEMSAVINKGSSQSEPYRKLRAYKDPRRNTMLWKTRRPGYGFIS
jgi:hypothetical protein